VALASGYHPRHSVLGIAWKAVTAAAMFALAPGEARTGAALDNPVLRTEGRVTMIDGILAPTVLLGLALNAAAGWWWADPAAGSTTPPATSAASSPWIIKTCPSQLRAEPVRLEPRPDQCTDTITIRGTVEGWPVRRRTLARA
jgi:hypothetical protein